MVVGTGPPVAQDGAVRVQDAHGLPLGPRQLSEVRQQPGFVKGELAEALLEVEGAAWGTGIGGGVAFQDGDGVAVPVEDAGEGQSARAAADHGDALSHSDTLYFHGTAYRNSTVRP
ncbi:hypothetical protein GCM10023205_45970 [Yinghuangia aomiensis]|uniref:Uncharacterized protein n=1 Tax=Yinghuangia aomiensis TaxID=676205 RepID=A0ABP9HMV2_9ACTN